MHLTLAPLFMTVGDLGGAIDSYKDSIKIYERITKKKKTTTTGAAGTTASSVKDKDNLTLLLGDARNGLASALFHASKFVESETQYTASCDIYESHYGEGTPPSFASDATAAAIEEMKDVIIETYGEEYYNRLRAQYESMGGGGGGGGGVGSGCIVSVSETTAMPV